MNDARQIQGYLGQALESARTAHSYASARQMADRHRLAALFSEISVVHDYYEERADGELVEDARDALRRDQQEAQQLVERKRAARRLLVANGFDEFEIR